jgi:demethylmenaquinone methyltransferase/2-methoxy-6-polyprenyl-1,4-benzoquinol methylase
MSPEYRRLGAGNIVRQYALRGYGKLGQEGMDRENKLKAQDILPIPRTKEEAKQAYDRISKSYDYTLGLLGRKYSEMALERLSIVKGETVLEIGFGTGHCLMRIAKRVGPSGKVYGIDISQKMIEKTKKRLENERLADRAELCCGDATFLPFSESAFDAVFMSFTLEGFDTPEIPRVLAQIKMVLKPGGRLGIIDMSKENGKSVFLKVYEWLHNKCPKYLGSRPIYTEQCLVDAGYQMKSKEKIKIFRLPAEIIVAIKAMP